MEEPQSKWLELIGLPAIVGALALVAALKTFSGLIGVVAALLAVLSVFLIIGAAMTLVKKR